MEVIAEFALAENFCMDYFLLLSAKLLTKNAAGWGRLALSAALGACLALLFPLMHLQGWAAVAVKLASGAALCLIGGKFSAIKDYFIFLFAFIALTALTGGTIIAAFTLAGWEYAASAGFIMTKIPVGIPLLAVLLIVLAAKYLSRKFSRSHERGEMQLIIRMGERSVRASGFFDSGNKVYYMGNPLTIIPQSLAEKIVNFGCIKQHATVHTVAGSKKIAVFRLDELQLILGARNKKIRGVWVGVSPDARTVILHPDLC